MLLTGGTGTSYYLHSTLDGVASASPGAMHFTLTTVSKLKFNPEWELRIHACAEPEADIHQLSLWTPLHQAAYMHAPKKVVEQLVRYGAFSNGPDIPTHFQNHV